MKYSPLNNTVCHSPKLALGDHNFITSELKPFLLETADKITEIWLLINRELTDESFTHERISYFRNLVLDAKQEFLDWFKNHAGELLDQNKSDLLTFTLRAARHDGLKAFDDRTNADEKPAGSRSLIAYLARIEDALTAGDSLIELSDFWSAKMIVERGNLLEEKIDYLMNVEAPKTTSDHAATIRTLNSSPWVKPNRFLIYLYGFEIFDRLRSDNIKFSSWINPNCADQTMPRSFSTFARCVIRPVVENAMDALKHSSSNDKRIRLNISKQGDEWIFRVRDSGPGIDPTILPKIFMRNTSTKLGQGHGEGLSIAKEILKSGDPFAGSIEVEATSRRGTTFLIKAKTLIPDE